MKFILQPWQLMLLALAVWVNREQQARIEYLKTEVDVLKEQIGKKRFLLSDTSASSIGAFSSCDSNNRYVSNRRPVSFDELAQLAGSQASKPADRD